MWASFWLHQMPPRKQAGELALQYSDSPVHAAWGPFCLLASVWIPTSMGFTDKCTASLGNPEHCTDEKKRHALLRREASEGAFVVALQGTPLGRSLPRCSSGGLSTHCARPRPRTPHGQEGLASCAAQLGPGGSGRSSAGRGLGWRAGARLQWLTFPQRPPCRWKQLFQALPRRQMSFQGILIK